MVHYDSTVIQAMADKLHSQARFIELIWALFGFVFIGAFLAAGGAMIDESMTVMAGAVGGVLGAAGGFSHGRAKAFTLRLTAQTALCQVQIERTTAESGSPGAQ